MGSDEGRIVSAPGRTRTCDPLLRKQVLYPLSYGRISLILPLFSASCKVSPYARIHKASASGNPLPGLASAGHLRIMDGGSFLGHTLGPLRSFFGRDRLLASLDDIHGGIYGIDAE